MNCDSKSELRPAFADGAPDFSRFPAIRLRPIGHSSMGLGAIRASHSEFSLDKNLSPDDNAHSCHARMHRAKIRRSVAKLILGPTDRDNEISVFLRFRAIR